MAEEKKTGQIAADRRLRTMHPFETRLKARSLYLRDTSLRKVSTELKIPIRTLMEWAADGHWKEEKQKIERYLAKKELRRIAEEAALELRNSGKLLNKAQDILETQFYKPMTDEKGEKIPGAFESRGKGDWKLSDESLMQLLLALTLRREQHLKTTLDFLGEYFPKVAPDKLKLSIAGRLEEEIAAAEAEEKKKKEEEKKHEQK